MKTHRKAKILSSQAKAKILTLGDLIAATYRDCGERRAPKILQMAMDTQLIRFKRPLCIG